jgi:hypothetical protein
MMFSTTIVRHGFRASLGVLAVAMAFGLASPMPASPTQAVQLVATIGSLDAGLAAQPHDPDTCKPGWVWREARPTDHVCVTDETRRETAAENAVRGSRMAGHGNYTCKSPFVWREAYPGDRVCAPVESRNRAHKDNAAAAGRRAPNPCAAIDGTSNGIPWGDSPTRYRQGTSPYLGTRTYPCAGTVVIFFGETTRQTSHYNIWFNGAQEEIVAGKGTHVKTMRSTPNGRSTWTVQVQSCYRTVHIISPRSNCGDKSPIITSH